MTGKRYNFFNLLTQVVTLQYLFVPVCDYLKVVSEVSGVSELLYSNESPVIVLSKVSHDLCPLFVLLSEIPRSLQDLYVLPATSINKSVLIIQEQILSHHMMNR